jgi:hypothetical protein
MPEGFQAALAASAVFFGVFVVDAMRVNSQAMFEFVYSVV